MTYYRRNPNGIYSDDTDAVERLQEKIARLESQRAAVKAANKAYRAEHKAELKGLSAYARDRALPYPAYVGRNLSGLLSTTRARLARLQAEQAQGLLDDYFAREDGLAVAA